MNTNPEVQDWLDELGHPLKEVILAVRAVILGAHPLLEGGGTKAGAAA